MIARKGLTKGCERTAPAVYSRFEMIETIPVKATLALGGGRSARSH